MTRSMFDDLLADYLESGATTAPDSLRDSVRRDLSAEKQRRRWLVKGARWMGRFPRGAILIPVMLSIAVVVVIAIDPFRSTPAPGAATPSPSPGAPSLQARLEAHEWQLDFAKSGLSPLTSSGRLAAFVRFEGGTLSGGAGVAGGCDRYDGRYTIDGTSLRVSIETGSSGCGGVGSEIRRRLSQVASLSVADCETGSCQTLSLLDKDDRVVLVFARP